MRLREGVPLLLALAVLAGSGCSRLSFVKPSAERRGGEQVAPDYSFRETPASRARAEARRQVSIADRHLRAG